MSSFTNLTVFVVLEYILQSHYSGYNDNGVTISIHAYLCKTTSWSNCFVHYGHCMCNMYEISGNIHITSMRCGFLSFWDNQQENLSVLPSKPFLKLYAHASEQKYISISILLTSALTFGDTSIVTTIILAKVKMGDLHFGLLHQLTGPTSNMLSRSLGIISGVRSPWYKPTSRTSELCLVRLLAFQMTDRHSSLSGCTVTQLETQLVTFLICGGSTREWGYFCLPDWLRLMSTVLSSITTSGKYLKISIIFLYSF